MRDYSLYLVEILGALDRIVEFIEGLDAEGFFSDEKTKSAVVRQIEIMGEASKCLSHELRERYAEVPWRRLTGMRDRLIHAYFDVDYGFIWSFIAEEFDDIRLHLERAIRELGHLND